MRCCNQCFIITIVSLHYHCSEENDDYCGGVVLCLGCKCDPGHGGCCSDGEQRLKCLFSTIVVHIPSWYELISGCPLWRIS